MRIKYNLLILTLIIGEVIYYPNFLNSTNDPLQRQSIGIDLGKLQAPVIGGSIMLGGKLLPILGVGIFVCHAIWKELFKNANLKDLHPEDFITYKLELPCKNPAVGYSYNNNNYTWYFHGRSTGSPAEIWEIYSHEDKLYFFTDAQGNVLSYGKQGLFLSHLEPFNPQLDHKTNTIRFTDNEHSIVYAPDKNTLLEFDRQGKQIPANQSNYMLLHYDGQPWSKDGKYWNYHPETHCWQVYTANNQLLANVGQNRTLLNSPSHSLQSLDGITGPQQVLLRYNIPWQAPNGNYVTYCRDIPYIPRCILTYSPHDLNCTYFLPEGNAGFWKPDSGASEMLQLLGIFPNHLSNKNPFSLVEPVANNPWPFEKLVLESYAASGDYTWRRIICQKKRQLFVSDWGVFDPQQQLVMEVDLNHVRHKPEPWQPPAQRLESDIISRDDVLIAALATSDMLNHIPQGAITTASDGSFVPDPPALQKQWNELCNNISQIIGKSRSKIVKACKALTKATGNITETIVENESVISHISSIMVPIATYYLGITSGVVIANAINGICKSSSIINWLGKTCDKLFSPQASAIEYVPTPPASLIAQTPITAQTDPSNDQTIGLTVSTYIPLQAFKTPAGIVFRDPKGNEFKN